MGIEIGALAAYAAIAGAAVSVYSAATTKKPQAPKPPAPPEAPPTMQDPQVSGDAFRRRAAAAGGIMSNISTSPQGIVGGAPTTGKTLLGQ